MSWSLFLGRKILSFIFGSNMCCQMTTVVTRETAAYSIFEKTRYKYDLDERFYEQVCHILDMH